MWLACMATSERSASACWLGSSRKSRIRLRPVDSVDRTCAAASAPLLSAFALGIWLSVLSSTTSGSGPYVICTAASKCASRRRAQASSAQVLACTLGASRLEGRALQPASVEIAAWPGRCRTCRLCTACYKMYARTWEARLSSTQWSPALPGHCCTCCLC